MQLAIIKLILLTLVMTAPINEAATAIKLNRHSIGGSQRKQKPTIAILPHARATARDLSRGGRGGNVVLEHEHVVRAGSTHPSAGASSTTSSSTTSNTTNAGSSPPAVSILPITNDIGFAYSIEIAVSNVTLAVMVRPPLPLHAAIFTY